MELSLQTPIHAHARAPALTPREYQLLRGLLGGRDTKELAFALDIAYTTAKVYYTHMATKLGVCGRVQLVLWAFAHPRDINIWPGPSGEVIEPVTSATI